MRQLAVLLLLVASVVSQDPVPAPAGSLALFDGQSTDAWVHRKDGSPCKWSVRDGAMEVTRGTSDILSKRHFSDFQLHLEFWLPKTPEGTGWQGRSNSGVYLQGRYEIQVLDSYGIDKLRPGDCGGIYSQKAADRNAARPPERWQSYDIHFTAPKFEGGKRTHKPRVTVFWNGVRIHDDVAINKPTTAHAGGDPSKPGPILLQNHGNPVRYRNVWIVEKAPAATSAATIAVPKLFADHMVLQRGREVPIWGTAGPGAKVRVTCGAATAEASSDAQGRFKVTLPKMPAGGPHDVVIESGGSQRVLKDVLIGEVWICSGQSNMRWRVNKSMNAKEEVAAASHPQIRLGFLKETRADAPQADAPITWAVCNPETIGTFSAVAYFFGRHLHKTLDGVPIGLLMTSWGGTPVEAWTSKAALQGDPVIDRWDWMKARNAQQWKKRLDGWTEKARVASSEGKPAPKKPGRPQLRNHHEPGALYNAMIAPLVPLSFRGAIWYQGESNASRAWQYRRLFPAMIRDWRARFGHDFPFYWVQLANFRKIQKQPVPSDWAELREAQSMTLSLPNTGEACAIDIGAANDIHPRNKQEVGRRLALLACKQIHGKDVVAHGPLAQATKFGAGKARLTFTEAGGLRARDDGAVTGFAIAGADKKWHWAKARIDGATVTVWSDSVKDPVAVRYGWADNPVCNLVNGAGLPAPPFRTDNWPGVTTRKER